MEWLIPAYYISVGLLTAVPVAGIANALIVDDRERRTIYLLFAFLGLLAQGYQLLCVGMLTATSLDEALFMLRWNIHFGNVGLVCLAVFVTLYTSQRVNRWLLGYMLTGCVLIALGNELSPYTLSYLQIEQLQQVKVPWGDATLPVIEGQASAANAFRSLFSFSILFWILYSVFRCWYQHKRLLAAALVFYALLQIITSIGNLLMEQYYGVKIPLAGFVFCLLVLTVWCELACTVQNETRVARYNLDRLAREIQQRRRAEIENQRLSQVFMQSPLPTQLIDSNGQVQDINAASRYFWQRDLTQPEPVNLLHLLQDHGVNGQELLANLQAGGLSNYDPIQLSPDGVVTTQTPWMEVSVFPLDTEYPQAVVMLEDVSSRVFVEKAIEHIARDVSEQSGSAFYAEMALDLQALIDADQVFIGWLNELEQPTHIDTVALVEGGRLRRNLTYELSGTPCEKVIAGRACAYSQGVQYLFPGDEWLVKQGINSYVGAPVYNRDHQVIGILSALYCEPSARVESLIEILDIYAARIGAEAHRMQADQKIRQLAYEDYLTGLPNRAHCHAELAKQLKYMEKHGGQATLMLIDLDHFKRINDALGHDVGDEVIRQLGRRLQQQFVTSGSLVASLGGDEFLLLHSEASSRPQAFVDVIATALIQTLSEPVMVGDHVLTIDVSIGVVLLPEQGRSVVEALRAAEIALYRAKDAGRCQYVLFDPQDHEVVRKKLHIERQLRVAIAQQQLEAWYQPQVDDQGRVIGAELLLRWPHPEEGMIPPDVFIPVAEESGLIHQLGDWVLNQAIAFIEQHGEFFDDTDLHLSVNVSPWQFSRVDFVENLIERFQHSPVIASKLILELTESTLLTDIDETRHKLQQLRKLGFAIALDDFGTGYSSLAYIRDLPLDELKIDKTFVSELQHQPANPLVESMVAIGRNMQLRVIAEGVESEQQQQRLISFGCQYFQGFFYARPMPEAQFISWLQQNIT